jgi:hypothetical protein
MMPLTYPILGVLSLVRQIANYQVLWQVDAPGICDTLECFFSTFEVRCNKSYCDRYQLLGKTSGGRRLKIIFQLKPGNIVRIITGWDI